MTIIKPMLAADVDDLSVLRYPLIATPKFDGIRCLIINGEARTRSLKLIQNAHIQSLLRQLPNGFDGEILAGTNFQDVTSAVMSRDGTPDFVYHVFDYMSGDPNVPYMDRIYRLKRWVAALGDLPYVKYTFEFWVNDRHELDALLDKMREEDEEGLCLRKPDGVYKFGRSTVREHGLLKVKFFSDSEAVIIGFDEQRENTNEKTTNELGNSKRSGAKGGLRPKGTLGRFIARELTTGQEIHVGTGKGLTAALRQEIWDNRAAYMGRVFKYQHQTVGEKDAPRLPTFQGFRDASDMGG